MSEAVKFNVNDQVSVVLTEAGAEHWNTTALGAPRYRAGQEVTMPMWELLAHFGSMFPTYPSTKHPLPFENNTITLKNTTTP